MARKKKATVQKLVMAGLGLAFIGFVAASTKDYSFLAGIAFVGVIILGIVGIIKLRRND